MQTVLEIEVKKKMEELVQLMIPALFDAWMSRIVDLEYAVIFTKKFLVGLEKNTRAHDPLRILRGRFHAPLHAVLDKALSKRPQDTPALVSTAPEMLERLREALALFTKDHALDHFDWSRSFLTAADIRELNDLPIRISETIAKVEGRDMSQRAKTQFSPKRKQTTKKTTRRKTTKPTKENI
jgi:hypothetical protein